MKKLAFIFCLIITTSSYAQQDSTVIPLSGVAGVVATADSTNDTLILASFLEIGDVYTLDHAGPANLLTVSLEEGDLRSYVVVRYNLLDFKGKVLYSNRYRVAGSCYEYFKENGIGYIFWKICSVKGFTIAE